MYILEQLFFNFQFNDYIIVRDRTTIFQKLLHSDYFFFLKKQFHGNIISWSIN